MKKDKGWIVYKWHLNNGASRSAEEETAGEEQQEGQERNWV